MKTYLVTGATSGLGLEIVKNLAENEENRVIMAIRNLAKGLEIAQEIGSNVESIELDLSKLSNIKKFIHDWDLQIDGLINNAGVQFVNETKFTQDGYEETIAVNHLAAFMLTIGLRPYLENGNVLFIGSGTHNPNYPLAKIFGFRGAQYTCIQELARGNSNAANTVQMNLDRYATSKLLTMITAVELSRRFENFSSYVLDPGLMPGTGLARNQTKIIQFLWKNVMPIFRFFLPDTTTAKKSGKAAAWIVSLPHPQNKSGTIYSYNKKPNRYVWEKVILDENIGEEVYKDSMNIIDGYLK